MTFQHEIETGCHINDLRHLMGAVAYTAEAVEQMAYQWFAIGPALAACYYAEADDGQDVAILALAEA